MLPQLLLQPFQLFPHSLSLLPQLLLQPLPQLLPPQPLLQPPTLMLTPEPGPIVLTLIDDDADAAPPMPTTAKLTADATSKPNRIKDFFKIILLMFIYMFIVQPIALMSKHVVLVTLV